MAALNRYIAIACKASQSEEFAMKSNIVYQYFKTVTDEKTIFIQFDSIRLKGYQLTISKSGEMELEEMEFDNTTPEQLLSEGYSVAHALEFHIILNGLNKI